jgi:hypothetical protein
VPRCGRISVEKKRPDARAKKDLLSLLNAVDSARAGMWNDMVPRGASMRSTLVSGVVAALVLVGIANPASASTIDQQQLSFDATTGFLSNVQNLAQTFTVGTTGRLTSISVEMAASSPITLNLLPVFNGSPINFVLASAISNPPSSPAWTTFNFSVPIPVFAGEVLAFEPSTSLSGGQVLGIDIANNAPNPYSGGQLFISSGISTGWQPFVSMLIGQGPIGGVDAAFQTQVAVTPLPPTWTMMLIGIAGFGFVAYRRKSTSAPRPA